MVQPGGGVLPLLEPCWLEHPPLLGGLVAPARVWGAAWGCPGPEEALAAAAAAFGGWFRASPVSSWLWVVWVSSLTAFTHIFKYWC